VKVELLYLFYFHKKPSRYVCPGVEGVGTLTIPLTDTKITCVEAYGFHSKKHVMKMRSANATFNLADLLMS
jgi:hypothetical protein